MTDQLDTAPGGPPPGAAASLAAYVPAILPAWRRLAGEARHLRLDGTLVFIDISGFTALSERLAAKGRAGAEELMDLLNGCFDGMVDASAAAGGDVLKFGGDALFVLFTGTHHTERACQAAARMLEVVLRPRRTSDGTRVALSASTGIHRGSVDLFLVEAGHLDVVPTGPATTRTLDTEVVADGGEILLSPEAAAAVPHAWLAERKGDGHLLDVEAVLRSEAVGGGDRALAPSPAELGRFVHPEQQRQILASATTEHRWATVGFVKVAHTDHLAAEAPEDLQRRLQALVAAGHEAAEANGTHWLATDVYHDGWKLLFTAGAPIARGDDEERMLHTLRRLLQAGAELDLDVRAGANRGLLFVGNLGASRRRTFTILGDAVNLAARLMQKAEAGQLVASASLLERSRGEWEVTPLEPFTVKGKSTVIQAAVVGAPLSRPWSRRPRAVEVVGRAAELARLDDLLVGALGGSGGALVLAGDAGIGKTSLVEAADARRPGILTVHAAAQPYDRMNPYGAARPLLRRALGIDPADDPVAAGEQLLATIADHAAELLPLAPLLAEPLGAEVPDTDAAAAVDPAFRKGYTESLVAELLTAELAGPSLLVLDDGQHADDASLDLFAALAAVAPRRPWAVLLLTTGEPPAGWDVLAVGPLEGQGLSRLAGLLGSDLAIGERDLARLVERSGGNPLFLAELVRAWDGDASSLPDSVEALVTARIDRLEPADRRVLRAASVVGNEVRLDLLERVLGGPVRLEPLAPFLEEGPTGAQRVRFRHELYRSVAYAGLSFRERRRAHLDVGLALEASEDPASVADVLATHFSNGGDDVRAWRYGVMAGDDAREASAAAEATALYDRALLHARGARAEPAEVARVAEALADVAEVAGRYDVGERAVALARKSASDDLTRLRLSRKRGILHERVGRYSAALQTFTRVLHGLEGRDGLPAVTERVAALLDSSGVRYRQGRWADGLRLARRAYDEAEPAGLLAQQAQALLLADASGAQLERGSWLRSDEQALELYQRAGDLVGQAKVLNNMGVEAYFAGQWEQSAEAYEESRELCARAGDVVGEARAANNLGEILSDQGRLTEAVELFRGARRQWRAARYAVGIALATSNLGRARVRLGELEAGATELADAREAFARIGAASFVLETDVRRAELAVARAARDGHLPPALVAADEVVNASRRAEGEYLSLAAALRIQAVARHLAGDHPGALAALRESVQVAAKVDATYEEALSLLELEELGLTGEAGAAATMLAGLGVVQAPRPWAPRH